MSEGYTIPLPWDRIAGSIMALIALLLLYLAPLNPTSRWIVFLVGALIGSYQFTRGVAGHIFTKKKVTTDVIMIGWLGPESLAAGSLGGHYYFFFGYFAFGVLGAVSPILAQHLGGVAVEVPSPAGRPAPLQAP